MHFKMNFKTETWTERLVWASAREVLALSCLTYKVTLALTVWWIKAPHFSQAIIISWAPLWWVFRTLIWRWTGWVFSVECPFPTKSEVMIQARQQWTIICNRAPQEEAPSNYPPLNHNSNNTWNKLVSSVCLKESEIGKFLRQPQSPNKPPPLCITSLLPPVTYSHKPQPTPKQQISRTCHLF
jgi:hypothetical protein